MRKMTVGDMFCGAGGTSHGLVNSDFAEIAWAINHDENCIEAHKKNHPNTVHYEEDIVSMDIDRLTPVDLLWASLECTHFSAAKGGQSRDADSRMLACQMYRYINKTDPKIVIIENVREFLTWGPLKEKRDDAGNIIYKMQKGQILMDENNQPIPVMIPDKEKLGTDYKIWVKTICDMGYDYDYSILDSADYGARTSRRRFFGVFVKKGLQVSFPRPTHAKNGKNGLAKWLPCRDFIDVADEGQSIFGREYNEALPKNVRKPLSDNTIKRIVAGIKKFCMKDGILFDPHLIMKYYGNGDNTAPLSEPLHTITTKDRHVLVTLQKEQFVSEHFGTSRSINEPMPTIMAFKDQKYLITVEQCVASSYNSDNNPESQVKSVDEPLNTITTTNKHSLVTIEKMRFIQQHFNSNNNPGANVCSIDDPLWTITTKHKEGFVTVETKGAYLLDVKTRFLRADELKVIQGFDAKYKLIGNQGVQKKAIGNSVVPLMAQKLIEDLFLQNCALLNL